MIYLGLSTEEKQKAIAEILANLDFDRVYFITHEAFNLDIEGVECVTYKDIIEYAYYYRIIENTTQRTAIILNEILRDRNRNNLTYNCIRTFLQSTPNVYVFNYLPIIDDRENFAALYDFCTKSRYKHYGLEDLNLDEVKIHCQRVDLEFKFTEAPLRLFDLENYEDEKEKIIEEFNQKDPDIIPRQLQLFSTPIKRQLIQKNKKYLCRNKRLKIKNGITYRDKISPGEYTIFDIPFNQIEFNDFLYFSGQKKIEVITTELKIDQFFDNRLLKFKQELDYVYSKIH